MRLFGKGSDVEYPESDLAAEPKHSDNDDGEQLSIRSTGQKLINIQGGGARYPYPKNVWSPAGASGLNS